jgi:dihydrofolate synthase / folylpolyglutamate synthase
MNYIKQLDILAKKGYSRHQSHKPSLARIRKMLRALGNPELSFPVIHVAGTNGKGSTAAMLHSILVAAGYRVGLYTSPHFIDCRERIRINHELISASDFERALAAVFNQLMVGELTYFEILTAAAFVYFAKKKVDFVVCEVGLGGRFDATNAAKNKLLSVITSIDIDHAEILGKEIKTIAAEKAGIIQSKVPTVIYTGHKAADVIIAAKAKVARSPIYFLGRDFSAKDEKIDWRKRMQFFSYNGINAEYKNIAFNLLGKHQVRNASLALAAIEILRDKYDISDHAIFRGFKAVTWSGRFEIFDVAIKQRCGVQSRQIQVILDGAHNVAGAKALADLLLTSPYAKHLTLVMSMLSDKDYRKTCRVLSEVAKEVVIFKANSSRALDPEILKREWSKYLSSKKIFVIDRFPQLFSLLRRNFNALCITGSLYAIADAIAYFKVDAGIRVIT